MAEQVGLNLTLSDTLKTGMLVAKSIYNLHGWDMYYCCNYVHGSDVYPTKKKSKSKILLLSTHHICKNTKYHNFFYFSSNLTKTHVWRRCIVYLSFHLHKQKAFLQSVNMLWVSLFIDTVCMEFYACFTISNSKKNISVH